MLTISYYFIKVILVSAIMFLYYWIVLRNKLFHQYNRFYLLGIGFFAWIIPIIKIHVTKSEVAEPTQFIELVNVVASNNSQFEEIILEQSATINWDLLALLGYGLVCSFLLLTLVMAFVKIYKLLQNNSCKNIGDVYLIITNAKGTPFSFFKYVFWNEAIDVNTPTGKQMMQHELIHVQEKHSADKLFMQLVIVFGWFNPTFWLVKKELNMIHEFIADNKAIQNGDTVALASMLLTAAYPQQQYLLSNPFFFSPIKRRLAMLTNKKNTKLYYARRVVVLPLLATIILLFAFRKKDAVISNGFIDKTYTVVIDAGHGGSDFGASALDGTTEKELNLLMLQAMKAANSNDKIKLIFTRETDVLQTPIEKAKFVNEQNADLFISLHMNWQASNAFKKEQGIEIYIPDNADRTNLNQCKIFAKTIDQMLQKSFFTNGVKTREQGIWIMKATTCPAALIECGFLSNPSDLAMLKDEAQRKKMATLILQGIANYLLAIETASLHTEQDWQKAAEKSTKYLDTIYWDKSLDAKTIIGKEKYNGSLIKKIEIDAQSSRIQIITSRETSNLSLQELAKRVELKKASERLYKYCVVLLEQGHLLRQSSKVFGLNIPNNEQLNNANANEKILFIYDTKPTPQIIKLLYS